MNRLRSRASGSHHATASWLRKNAAVRAYLIGIRNAAAWVTAFCAVIPLMTWEFYEIGKILFVVSAAVAFFAHLSVVLSNGVSALLKRRHR
jgi:hypothetical protein